MSELISRQAVIDTLENTKTAISENGERYIAKQNAIMRIDALPPAEPRLIRCRDCTNNRGKFCSVANHYVGENDDCISVFGAKRRTK